MKNSPYFDRETSHILKGIAIILMFALHFFTHPEWYIYYHFEGMEAFADFFLSPFNLCVSIFAFLTGYNYVFHKEKSILYSARKITDLYITFAITFIPVLIASWAFGVYHVDPISVIMQALLLEFDVMLFCWYVAFYFVTMLLLPYFTRTANKNALLALSLGVLLPFLLFRMCYRGIVQEEPHLKLLSSFLGWLPSIFIGVIFARWGLFQRVFDKLFKQSIPFHLQPVLFLILLFIGFTGPAVFPGFDFWGIYFELRILYAPILIYAIVNLCNRISWKRVFSPLAFLGKYSLGLWFVHCVFFGPLQPLTEPILVFPQHPVLVLLWGLILCLPPAIALIKAANWLNRKKNDLLFRKKVSE